MMRSSVVLAVFLCSSLGYGGLGVSKVSKQGIAGRSLQETVRRITGEMLPSLLEFNRGRGVYYQALGYALEVAQSRGLELHAGESFRDVIDTISHYELLPVALKANGIDPVHTDRIGEEIREGNTVLLSRGLGFFHIVTPDADAVETLNKVASSPVDAEMFIAGKILSADERPTELYLRRMTVAGFDSLNKIGVSTILPEDRISLAALEVAMLSVQGEEETKLVDMFGDNWRDYLFFVANRINPLDVTFKELLDDRSTSSIVEKLMHEAGMDDSDEASVRDYLKANIDSLHELRVLVQRDQVIEFIRSLSKLPGYDLANASTEPQYFLQERSVWEILEAVVHGKTGKENLEEAEQEEQPNEAQQELDGKIAQFVTERLNKVIDPEKRISLIVAEIEKVWGVDNLLKEISSATEHGMAGGNDSWTEEASLVLLEMVEKAKLPDEKRKYLERLVELLAEKVAEARQLIEHAKYQQMHGFVPYTKEVKAEQHGRFTRARNIVAEVVKSYRESFYHTNGSSKQFTTRELISELGKVDGWQEVDGTNHAKVKLGDIIVSGITRTSGSKNGNNIAGGRLVQIIKETTSVSIERRLKSTGVTIENLLLYDTNREREFLKKGQRSALEYAKGFFKRVHSSAQKGRSSGK